MLKLTFVTPVKKFFEAKEVEEVRVPAHRGELTILTQHSPLVTTLDTGRFAYREPGKTEFEEAVVSWGYCEVMDGEVKILAEVAETRDMLDKDSIQKDIESAEANITKPEATPDDIDSELKKLRQAHARMGLTH